MTMFDNMQYFVTWVSEDNVSEEKYSVSSLLPSLLFPSLSPSPFPSLGTMLLFYLKISLISGLSTVFS